MSQRRSLQLPGEGTQAFHPHIGAHSLISGAWILKRARGKRLHESRWLQCVCPGITIVILLNLFPLVRRSSLWRKQKQACSSHAMPNNVFHPVFRKWLFDVTEAARQSIQRCFSEEPKLVDQKSSSILVSTSSASYACKYLSGYTSRGKFFFFGRSKLPL